MTKPNAFTVQGIKLSTGDELVAEIREIHEDGSLTVREALMMIMQPSGEPNGGMMCNFYPWTIINAEDIKIRANQIVANYNVPGDVEQSYIQNTSGLQIVSGAAAQQILHG